MIGLIVGFIFSLWNVIGLTFAATQSVEWVNYLLNGGPFAIVVFLVLMEKLITPSERDNLREENARLRREITDLNNNIRNDIFPALNTSNTLLQDVFNELNIRERERRRGD